MASGLHVSASEKSTITRALACSAVASRAITGDACVCEPAQSHTPRARSSGQSDDFSLLLPKYHPAAARHVAPLLKHRSKWNVPSILPY